MDLSQTDWSNSNSMDLFDQDFQIGEWNLPSEPIVEPPPTLLPEPLVNAPQPKRRRPRSIQKTTATKATNQAHKRLKSIVCSNRSILSPILLVT